MTSEDYFQGLSLEVETEFAVRIAKLTVPAWERYADNDNLIFTDNSFGLIHQVERGVLQNALKEIEDYITLSKDNGYLVSNSGLIRAFENMEEIVLALEEGDWELPVEVERTFYCIYNLLKELTGETETQHDILSFHLSVNRAAEALENLGLLSEQQIVSMVDDIKNNYTD